MTPEIISIVDHLFVVLEIIGGSAILAAIFPNADASKVNGVLSVMRKLIDFAGFNFGNAKNK